MLKKLVLLLLTVFILSATTCEEEVDLSLQTPPPKLVINSSFSPDQPFEVLVSKTQGLFEKNAFQDIEDAIVEIYQGNVFVEKLELSSLSPSYYEGNSFPVSGKNYSLKIQAPGLPSIEAENTIPKKVDIASVKVTGVRIKNLQIIGPGEEDKEYLFTVKTTINDPENTVNYYHLNFYIEPIQYAILAPFDTAKIVLPPFGPLAVDDPIDNSPAAPFLLEGALIKDQSFNGQQQSFSFDFSYQLDSSDELVGNVIVELRSVSKEYYLYHSSLHRHIQAQVNPLSEPVIVFNNIQEGYGIFSGYDLVESESIPIKE